MISPIVPLASSIGLKKGTHAFFIGSGVSAGAGVPTGNEITRKTAREAYDKIEEPDEFNHEDFEQWLHESSFEEYIYSEILENIYPTAANRRAYHEEFFEGKEPSQAHKILTELVEHGYIKVILTTNFDPLIEKALEDKDISYTRVANEEDLETTEPREHSECYLMKLHGDWRKTDIKVTEEELIELEPAIRKELNLILHRYGLVVMGYAGEDQGVMENFEQATTPYGLYWCARDNLNDSVEKLLNEKNGFEIDIQDADDFMTTLKRKISRLEVEKRDEAALELSRLVEGYLREEDQISIDRAISRVYRNTKSKAGNLLNENSHPGNSEEFQQIATEVQDEADKLIAVGLPLIGRNRVELFNSVQEKFHNLNKVSPRSGSTWITDFPLLLLHNSTKLWGSLALEKRDFEVLNNLLIPDVPFIGENWDYYKRMVRDIHFNDSFEGLCGKDIGDHQNYFIARYEEKDLIEEFFYTTQDWKSSLTKFRFLLILWDYVIFDEEPTPLPIPMFKETEDIKALIKLVKNLAFDPDFCASISQIYDESQDEFIHKLYSRIEVIIQEQGLGRFKANFLNRIKYLFED